MPTEMEKLGFDDPDCVGSSEYRAIHECIQDAIESVPDEDPKEVAVSILQEFLEIATSQLARLAGQTQNTMQTLQASPKQDIDQFTARESCTVLAALRYWQRTVEEPADASPDHFEDVEPLNDDEIDDLCERILIDWTKCDDDKKKLCTDPRCELPAGHAGRCLSGEELAEAIRYEVWLDGNTESQPCDVLTWDEISADNSENQQVLDSLNALGLGQEMLILAGNVSQRIKVVLADEDEDDEGGVLECPHGHCVSAFSTVHIGRSQ